MFDIFGGFSASKLKPQLKMAVSRFQIASNKKSALSKQNMRAAAVLLAEDPPKEEKARIIAESLIRDDNIVEAYDILSMSCQLLFERMKLIEYSKDCPPDLVSTISTLIYAAPRVDIPELVEIRKQFKAKYGKKFEEAALNNEGGILNERVVTKLSVQPPAAGLVQTYLEKICAKYEVDWSPSIRLSTEEMGAPMAAPSGYSVPIAQGTGLGKDVAIAPPPPRAPGKPADEWTELPKEPEVFVPSANTTIATNQDDDFAEPDIFIPAAPGQKSTSSTGTKPASNPPSAPPQAPPPAPTSKPDNGDQKNNNDDNKDDDDSPLAPNGGDNPSNQSSSYRDLAARFENLKNL